MKIRSPFERIEEWYFKQFRKDPFATFTDSVDETKRFRELVESTDCPACKAKVALELVKFERGPKGWEADVTCSNCTFKGVISQLSTVMLDVNSKGQAVKTDKVAPRKI